MNIHGVRTTFVRGYTTRDGRIVIVRDDNTITLTAPPSWKQPHPVPDAVTDIELPEPA